MNRKFPSSNSLQAVLLIMKTLLRVMSRELSEVRRQKRQLVIHHKPPDVG